MGLFETVVEWLFENGDGAMVTKAVRCPKCGSEYQAPYAGQGAKRWGYIRMRDRELIAMCPTKHPSLDDAADLS